MTDINPLLASHELPTFDAIRPEHVTPAIEALIAESNQALERAVGDSVPAEYQAMAAALDVPVERLRRAWGAVNHLQAVADTPALRAAYTENLPRVTEFYTRLGADERLYAKYKAIASSSTAASLTPAQRKALDDALRDFRLGGAELQGTARERFAELQERMAELSQQFGEHVLDATDAFAHYATDAEVDGLPDDVKQAARQAAQADGREGYKLTLQYPSLAPVMQYAKDRALREKIFTANVTRASEFGPAALDNTALMAELIALREEEARLLGYANYAELSLVAKMAESPKHVDDFLYDLARRARPFAERDLRELEDFARTHLGLPELQAWDRSYASEKLKQSRYAFSSEEVKQYFTEPRVLGGLFKLIETLFDVAIRPATASVWHDTVRFYSVERDGQPIAAFYLDLYARAGKQSGAWMDDVRQRWRRPDAELTQLPVAHLVCNFAPPVGHRPALLTHDDVITLFHEFGHGLHHMLTQVDELAVSGIAGVEWDAAELPSQFMENFCWEWDIVSDMTAHVDTGAPLPRALFDRMVAARNFQSGLAMLRYCEMALLDMRIHEEPAGKLTVLQTAEALRSEVAVYTQPAFNRYPNTFTHIFDGGYSAGYYGYSWAEVLSADAFSAFEEAGLFDVATGRRWRETVLEVGGSRSAMESFVAFRGRAPTIDALLRHQGMVLPEAA